MQNSGRSPPRATNRSSSRDSGTVAVVQRRDHAGADEHPKSPESGFLTNPDLVWWRLTRRAQKEEQALFTLKKKQGGGQTQ